MGTGSHIFVEILTAWKIHVTLLTICLAKTKQNLNVHWGGTYEDRRNVGALSWIGWFCHGGIRDRAGDRCRFGNNGIGVGFGRRTCGA